MEHLDAGRASLLLQSHTQIPPGAMSSPHFHTTIKEAETLKINSKTLCIISSSSIESGKRRLQKKKKKKVQVHSAHEVTDSYLPSARWITVSGGVFLSLSPVFPLFLMKKKSLHPDLLTGVDSPRPRFGNQLKPGLETGEEP